MTRLPPWVEAPPRRQITPAVWLTAVSVIVILAALCSCDVAPSPNRRATIRQMAVESIPMRTGSPSAASHRYGLVSGVEALAPSGAEMGTSLPAEGREAGNLHSSLSALEARLLVGRMTVERWRAARHVEERARLHHRHPGPSRGTTR